MPDFPLLLASPALRRLTGTPGDWPKEAAPWKRVSVQYRSVNKKSIFFIFAENVAKNPLENAM